MNARADIFDLARRSITPALIEILFPGGKWERGEYWTLNPLRTDKTPGSFSISETGLYNDFSSADKGDLISLVSKARGITPAEAAALIIETAGGTVPVPGNGQGKQAGKEKPKPVIPIPPENLQNFKHHARSNFIVEQFGEPVKAWQYNDKDGLPWCIVVRFEKLGKKNVVPFYYGIDNKFHAGNPVKKNRSLFNIDRLNREPILVVEGEKCASIEVPGYTLVTWIGGTAAVHLTDWTPLHGLNVIVWPDADEPGFKAALYIAGILPGARVLDIQSKPKGWDIADAAAEGLDLLEFIRTCPLVKTQSAEATQFIEHEEKRGRPKVAKQVLRILETYALCKYRGRSYLADGNTALEIGSGQYRDFVSRLAYIHLKTPPSETAIKEVVSIQRAAALFESPTKTVYTRIAAPAEDKTFIDLCDDAGRIIEVTPDGWRLVEKPDVLFFRPGNLKPLPIPETPGSTDLLVNLFNLKNDSDLILIITSICFWMRGRPGERGSYSGLNFHGPEGSAKSTASSKIKYLIDPSTPDRRTAPKEPRDFYIAARHCHLPLFDNLSYISGESSDTLCAIETGGGYAKKQNYTDDDEIIIETCNPILTNGISCKKAPDLAQRTIDIELETIPPEKRRTEADIWQEMERIRPVILGGLLTCLSNTLKAIRDGFKVPALPRLADYGYFSTAFEIGNGWKQGLTLNALNQSYQVALDGMGDENPVLKTIHDYIVMNGGEFIGTASDLLTAIDTGADDRYKKLEVWPKTPAGLGAIITRYVNVLGNMDIIVKRGKGRDRRIMTITLNNANNPAPELPFDDQVEALF